MNISYKNLKLFTCGTFVVMLVAGFTSCGKKDANSPGFEFMPDMYRSPSVENYGTYIIGDDTLNSAMLPVKGTIARGYIPYVYPNTVEGYEQAGMYLKNPLALTPQVEKDGEVLFGKFCIHCHGATGAGDGKVAAKLPGPPPAYNGPLKNLPEGKIFHSITYGKNSMGNHASLLNTQERWTLVHYVQKLQGPKTVAVDSTVKAVPTNTVVAKP
ncbi:MAG: cytochrome c [Bacteroidia bacterium]|jgi:mono/diheme cytochrome c family protein|nr:cytochrome c [Bacteroidia bacterium]